MNRLSKLLVLSWLLVLIVVSAADVMAGPPNEAWWRFTNTNAGNVDLTFQVQAKQNITVAPAEYNAVAGQEGARIANALAYKLCQADCNFAASTCDTTIPGPPFGIAANTGVCVTNNGSTYTIATMAVGFPNSIHVAPTVGAIKAAQVQWNAVFAADLLSTYTVRLDPNGNNGIATFDVEDASENSLGSFNVNTTGQTDLQIHTAIRNGYLSLGLGLGAIVCDQSTLATESVNPAGFPGYGVRVTYPSNVRGFEVIPVPNQKVTAEMTGTSTVNNVPTMSEWGMAILVALLLVTGIWMMRRRQRLQSA